VREVRNGLSSGLKGLEAGLPDKRQLDAERTAAMERLDRSRAAAEGAREARRKAEDALGREEPKWKEWEVRRDRIRSLESERGMAQHAVETARHEFQRLDRELAEALTARTELERIAI